MIGNSGSARENTDGGVSMRKANMVSEAASKSSSPSSLLKPLPLAVKLPSGSNRSLPSSSLRRSQEGEGKTLAKALPTQHKQAQDKRQRSVVMQDLRKRLLGLSVSRKAIRNAASEEPHSDTQHSRKPKQKAKQAAGAEEGGLW